MGKKTILIIDDNKFILKPLKVLLSRMGYMVKTVTSGRGALAMQKSFADLVLLDLRLQGVEGQEGQDICLKIKGDKKTNHIPIIMFSADSRGEILAKKVGADDFIAKPFSMANLVKKIEEYI